MQLGTLRILLALSVVLAHTGPLFGTGMVGGKLAVQSFFIISGFYMSLILNEKYVGERYSYRLFITNRLLRIYPLYLVVLLSCIAVSGLVFLLGGNKDLHLISAWSTYTLSGTSVLFLVLSNIFIFGIDLSLFLSYLPNGDFYLTDHFQSSVPPVHSFILVPQAWSLSLELYFYFIAPFFLRSRGTKLFLLLLSSILLRVFLHQYAGFTDDPWTYRFFFTELFFFILGAYSYQVYCYLKIRPPTKTACKIVFVTVILFLFLFERIDDTANVLSFSLAELLFLGVVFCSLPFLFYHFRDNRFDSVIGELSYPIYIVHLLVLTTLDLLLDGEYLKIATILATIVFSVVLNRFIAYPIEKFRQKRVIRHHSAEGN